MIFQLFSNCIPVKGAKVAVICDLLRNTYITIPLALYEILTLHKNKDVKKIKLFYNNEYDQIIDDYYEFLLNEELGFWNNEVGLVNFPDMNMNFESPSVINNAIIDIDNNSVHDYEKYFAELDFLGCRFIQLRFFSGISINDLMNILHFLKGKRFKNIEIFLKYSNKTNETLKKILPIFREFPVGRIIVHSSPFEKDYSQETFYYLIFTKELLENEQCCGNISKNYFNSNISFFTESLEFNTCLNKKISVDKSGNIKNCPSMLNSFGKAIDISFIDVISNNRFTEYWHINKNQIKVCQDCQFRHICSDCRAYVEDKFDKPQKCNYDPYTNVWK